MKKLLTLTAVLLFWPLRPAAAQSWDLGTWGTVSLPTDFSAALPTVGYDFIQKQAIAGVSTPLLTLVKEINGYVGVVGEFQSPSPNVQPYLAIGYDVAKHIPWINQIQSLQIQGFGRYVASTSNNDHLGAGVAIAYKWGAPPPVTQP